MPNAVHIQEARRYYKWLLWLGALYVLAVSAESAIYGVGFFEFLRVGYGIVVIVMKFFSMLFCLGAVAFIYGFCKKGAKGMQRFAAGRAHYNAMSRRYLDGELFAYTCIGMLALAPAVFYFIQKSLIEYVNPFSWDAAFAKLDYLLHFNHYPDTFVVAIVDRFGLGGVIDAGYFFWFAVMYLGLCYNIFWDNNRRRRLRFLWVFVLCWVLLGSVMGTVFSSVGPIFYHDFLPGPDPYHEFVIYSDKHGPTDFPIAYFSRQLLLQWTTGGRMVNPNAIAAFPSLHMAIAWLVMLYFWGINRAAGIAAVLFCILIYAATIFVGFHYAIDSYVSIILVSLMWWGAGIILRRFIPADAAPIRRLAPE